MSVRQRKPTGGSGGNDAPPPPVRRHVVANSELPVLELTPLSQVALGLVFVMSIVTLIFAILTYAEMRSVRHTLAAPPGGNVTQPAGAAATSLAKAGMDMAAEVFRRKKQALP